MSKELSDSFEVLKKRILSHRKHCENWQLLKPCFDCHYNTLTRIESAINELRR